MLEKILKIVSTIDSCKFTHQLESCLIMIENFERDEKPRDPRIIRDLMSYYRNKQNELIRVSKSNPILIENNLK